MRDADKDLKELAANVRRTPTPTYTFRHADKLHAECLIFFGFEAPYFKVVNVDKEGGTRVFRFYAGYNPKNNELVVTSNEPITLDDLIMLTRDV